jgi:hypothetical protein
MSNDVAYVALLGPVQAGKTALIPSLQRSAKHTHGLDGAVKITVRQDEQEFSPDDAAAGPGPVPFRKARLKEVNKRSVGRNLEPGSTSTADVSQCPLLFTFETDGRSRMERRLSIIDSGGGLFLATERDREDRAAAALERGGQEERRRAELTKILQERAAGIIFCIDITWKNTDQWEESFDDLLYIIRSITVSRARPILRIALTFTKTDQLFLLEGRDAARQALSRVKLKRRLKEAVESGVEILDKWRKLQSEHADKIDIACFATSVFGYIHENGCVNYSFNRRNWLLGDDNLFEALGISTDSQSDDVSGSDVPQLLKFWRPMLTVDPFIYAGFGYDTPFGDALESRYMFTLEDFLGPSAAPPRRRRRRIGPFEW